MDIKKTCTKCGSLKVLLDFPTTIRNGQEKREAWCRECKRAYYDEWEKREVERVFRRKYYNDDSEYREARLEYRRRRRRTVEYREHCRNYQLVRHFGITAKEYDARLESQNGVCAICFKLCKTGRRLAVDHNHVTKNVRGLLCRRCNQVLGVFEDSSDLFSRAAAYLQKEINVSTV